MELIVNDICKPQTPKGALHSEIISIIKYSESGVFDNRIIFK